MVRTRRRPEIARVSDKITRLNHWLVRLFHGDRPRKENIVLQVNVLVKVGFKVSQQACTDDFCHEEKLEQESSEGDE